jgi:hypothetical protein
MLSEEIQAQLGEANSVVWKTEYQDARISRQEIHSVSFLAFYYQGQRHPRYGFLGAKWVLPEVFVNNGMFDSSIQPEQAREYLAYVAEKVQPLLEQANGHQ